MKNDCISGKDSVKDINQNINSNSNIELTPDNRELIVFLRCLLSLQTKLNIDFYFVGGCVRDALFNTTTIDIDIAIKGDLIKVQESICKDYELNLSLFGTAKLTLGRYHIDLAQFRKELYLQNNGLPTISEGDLESDILRRDFTINTGYVPLSESSINWILYPEPNSKIEIAYSHPKFYEDIQNRTLRILHENSFMEDASRLLRAVKYMTLNSLKMEPLTEMAFVHAIDAHALQYYSPNRYRQIILNYLNHERGLDLLAELHKRGLLLESNPNFKFEDIASMNLRNKGIKFFLDAPQTQLAQKYLMLLLLYENKLEFWVEADKKISGLAKTCVDLIQTFKESYLNLSSKYDLYKQLTNVDFTCIAFLVLAKQVDKAIKNQIMDYIIVGSVIKLYLNGNDLLALGMNPGKEIGNALNLLLEYEVNSGVNLSKEEEIDWIESYMYEHRD